MGLMLLTDEENPFRRKQGEYDYNEQPYEADAFDEGAKAQLKKMVDYRDEKCDNATHKAYWKVDERRYCSLCMEKMWQALLDEVKDV